VTSRSAAARKGWETRRRKQATAERRSLAAKKGWETRRRKQALAERRKRSLAAKKGWETRRRRQAMIAGRQTAGRQTDRRERALDDEEFEEWSDILGIPVEDVEAMSEVVDLGGQELSGPELASYLEELSELTDVDISDLYDMWYGYTPGGES